MRRTILATAAFVLLLFTFGCERTKVLSTGNDDDIIVFADTSTWGALQNALRQTFEDTMFTPQPERLFTLRWTDFNRLDEFATHKNRIVVAPLDGEGSVAAYLRTALDSTVRRLVEEQKEFVFTKYDVHARQQLVMYLAAPSVGALKASIESRAPDLLFYFTNMTIKRELASLQSESRYNKRHIEEHLQQSYGWTMTVQHDYEIAIDSAAARFVWIRRATPADMERWIFVHWIDTESEDTLTDRFAVRLRNAVTERFLRTIDDRDFVEIAPYFLEVQQVNFLGRFAYEMRGNWRFSDKSGGGPFVNYTFYDDATKRIYMLDGSIFAPRVDKKKLIAQVDGLLHTFKTLSPTSEQTITQ